MRLVLAAFLGAAGTFLLTTLKAARDEQRDLCDTLGDKLLSAADLAAEYWLKAGDDTDLPLLEAKLMGVQAYLGRYKLIASSWFSPRDRKLVNDLFADFYDAMTNGQFKVKNRPTDVTRAQDCQVLAAELAVTLRQANLNSLTIRSMFVRASHWHRISKYFTDQFQWSPPKP